MKMNSFFKDFLNEIPVALKILWGFGILSSFLVTVLIITLLVKLILL